MNEYSRLYNIYFSDLDTIYTDCYIRNKDDLVKRKLLLNNRFDKPDKISLVKAVDIINEKPIICWGANCGVFDYTNRLIIDILIEKGANPENIIVPYRRLGNRQGLSIVTTDSYKTLDNIDIANSTYKELNHIGYDALEYEILQLYTYYTLSFIKLRNVEYRIKHYNNTAELRMNEVKQLFNKTVQENINKLRQSNLSCADKIITNVFNSDNAGDALRKMLTCKKEFKSENEQLYKEVLHDLRKVRQSEAELNNGPGYAILGVNIPDYNRDSHKLTDRHIIMIERYTSDIINKISDDYINISIVAPAWQVTNDIYEAKEIVTCGGKHPFEIVEKMDKDEYTKIIMDRHTNCIRNMDIQKRNEQLKKALEIIKKCYALGIYVRMIEDGSITFAIRNDNNLEQNARQLLKIVEYELFLPKVRKIALHSNDSIIYTVNTYKNKDIKEIYTREI